MMNDVELLVKLLNPRALSPSQATDSNERKAILKEGSPPNHYQVTIKGLQSDALVLKADTLLELKCIFNSKKGCRKCADYIIVNSNTIVFIELKSNTAKRKHIQQQLKGAKCLMEYCTSVGREFYNRPNFLSEFTKRFAVIAKINLNKTRTNYTAKQSGNGNSPDTMLKFLGGHTFNFKQFC